MLSWQERHDDAAAHVVPFLRRTAALDGARVLEFGAGAGPISCALAPHAATVLALDIAADYVGHGRRIVAERAIANVELRSGSFEALLDDAAEVAGEVDVFLLFAVLEHMTFDERLAVLACARDVLAPGGSLCVFETPNRLLWWDYHTSELPFFGMLETPLALAYADRIERPGLSEQLSGDDGPLALARAGRGVSYHEFELALGPLNGRIVAGGYEPELFPIRHVHREELYLSRFASRLPAQPSPVFTRYWLDFVVRSSPPEAAPLARPWPFATDTARDVALTRWETLCFTSSDAWLDLPAGGATELLLGVEGRPQPVTLSLEAPGLAPRSIAIPPGAGTEYVVAPLGDGVSTARLVAPADTYLSFVAFRGPSPRREAPTTLRPG